MPRARRGPGAPNTAQLLGHLLTKEESYRRQWRQHVRRRSRQEPHQGAVGAVLATHLWDTGEAPEDDLDLPRRMKDVVSRALSGTSLSSRSLAHFIEAFQMSDEDAGSLWSAFEEDRRLAYRAAPADADREQLAPPSPAYRILQVDEHHVLGPEGIPARHTTRQVIEALAPMDRYSYHFDTSAASVSVVRGGTAGPMHPTGQEGIFGIDIVFPQVLETGSTRVLEYTTYFSYAERPPPEFRRLVRSTLRSVAIQVDFHPACLPRRVWWASWPDLHSPPEWREEVVLDDTASVTRFRRKVSESLIGFTWEWGP